MCLYTSAVLAFNVPVVYMARDVIILMRATSLERAIWRGGSWKSRHGKEWSECHLGPKKYNFKSSSAQAQCSCKQWVAWGPATGAVDCETRLGLLLQPHAAPCPTLQYNGHSTIAPMPSSNAVAECRWAKRRRMSPPPASSPVPVLLQLQHRPRLHSNSNLQLPPLHSKQASAATHVSTWVSCHYHHLRQLLFLKPLFLARLPGFLHGQRKHHPQADIRNAIAGHVPSWRLHLLCR